MKHNHWHNPGRRLLSVLLAAILCLSLLPGTVFAVQTGSTDASRTVFDALGFDTSAPQGYQQEEGITGTPFGKTYTTMAEVDELFVLNTNSNQSFDTPQRTAYLFGHEKATGGSISSFFTQGQSASSIKADAALAVEGNFSTDNNGQKKNVAVLSYTNTWDGSDHRKNVYLNIGSATDLSTLKSNYYIVLNNRELGNGDDYSGGYFKDQADPYQYMQLAAGDFDGDGIDEIAVYVGCTSAVDYDQIRVFKLQQTDGDSYISLSKNSLGKNWKEAWSYNVPKINGNWSPNKVSLIAADVDKNGVDDLAFAYGNIGGGRNVASKVLVFLGADKGEMLSRQQEIALDTVYRAGLAVGDVDGDGRNELVVGGSPSASSGKTRSLAIYAWNGTGFDRLASKSVTPDGKYLSNPALAANMAVGAFYGVNEGPCIYMDSIILKYSSDGLSVLGTVNCQSKSNSALAESYKEWGARAADFTGSGQEVVCVNTVPDHDTTSDLSNRSPNQYLSFLSFSGSGQNRSYSIVKEYSATVGDSGGNVYDGGLELRPCAVPFCLPNTDTDTIMLKYTGEHYYTYADPEVLAVLASPPYFADLANDDDDSQMIESKTSYSSTKGSGGGSTYSNSFSVGVYTSWEQSFSILGVELAHAEAETSINNTFTWETQKTSSVEYQVEYATMAGLDTVVLYALPIETYVYEATMPGGETQTMTVNIPYQPSVRTISAEEYSGIQKVYSDLLPDVSQALTHTVGDPASYAKGVSDLPVGPFSQTLIYDGDFATIGQGSQNTISQTIEMTSETENSFNYDLDVETKAGFGSGGITVGVTAGYSHGAGSVHITTAGSTYSGEMNGLPTQAQQYGYTFNWKLVGFLWQGEYPVVTYLVNDVVEPPLLPENFGASEEDTTTDQIALEWDYAGNAAGFILYRYFQSPSSSGYYQIATVGSGDYQSVSDGVKHYQYIDKGLSANTGYKYRIQTIGMSQPNTSIPSEPLSTYTKSETGTPKVAVSDDNLAVYPDVKVSTTAYLTNSDEFQDTKVYYQWQKQSGRYWEDVKGETAATLTFLYPDQGVEGVYRCKVSALVNQNLVSVYSPEVTVTFAQRESKITDLTIDGQTLTATVTGSGAASKPSGTVTFVLTATDGTETIYTAAVDKDGKASVTVDPPAAVYKVTASYSGSKIFLPASYDPETPTFYTKNVTVGSFVDVKDSYVYGDEFNFQKYTVQEDGSVEKAPFTVPAWDSIAVQPDGKVSLPSSSADDIKARFNAGRAGWIGDAAFTDDGNTYTVHVVARPVEIVGLTSGVYPYGTAMSELLESATVRNLVPDWAEADGTDKMSTSITNLSGINSSLSDPGTYKVRVTSIGNRMYSSNYEVTCPTVQIVIAGKGYPVSAAVAEGQSTWGIVKVVYPEDTNTATVGQTLIFQATANPGYAIDRWYTVDESGENKTAIEGSEGKDSLTLIQVREGTHVIVEFRTKSNTLTTFATPDGAGEVTTDAKYFQSGNTYPAGYEIEFTAKPNDGWHFTGWEYYEAGQNTLYGSEDTYTVKMPDNSVTLTAKFARNAYALTLSEGLAAYDQDGKRITDLTAIPGDTEVTVKPAPGFDLSDGATWKVDGAALDPQPANGTYTFTMTANTSVSAAVTAQTFSVALSMEGITGGTAELTGAADGKAAAGTLVTYSAEADRGYTFGGWKNAEGIIVSESASYAFAVDSDVTLTPVFTEKEYKTFTVGEKIDWTITDAAGEEVTTTMLKLYPGETLTLTAQPRNGNMVKGWTINGTYTADVSKVRTFAYRDLADSNTFNFTSQPITYFKVEFADDIDATADGKTIRSGDLVGAGSELKFVYTGDGTVTKWLNNGVAYSLTRDLVVNDLTSNLNITVETSAEELAFYSVTDMTAGADQEIYQAWITGEYRDDATGKFAEGSHVAVTLEPVNSQTGIITGVSCDDLTFTRDESGVWTAETDAIEKDITFTVTVERKQTPPAPETYTITFNANGGTLTGASSAETDENGRLRSLPTPVRSGYTFDGWYTAAVGGTKVTAQTVFTRDTEIYAHWTKNGSSGGNEGDPTTPTYPVVPPKQVENGTVTISPRNASAGTEVTITVTPDQGYVLKDLRVTDENGNTIKLTNRGHGRYTFTMPAGSATVDVSFRAASVKPVNPFTDVPSGAYYEEAVIWAVSEGITNGTTATTFSPNASCTRGQMVTFLWRAAGCPRVSGRNPFTDVSANAYYYEAVLWAVKNGITNGTTATTFDPNATVTRAQTVTFLYRAAGSPAASGFSFSDVRSDAYYANAVAWAVQKGITSGTGNGQFSPNADCTRAQIVTFLFRLNQMK